MAHLGKSVDEHVFGAIRGNRVDADELNGKLLSVQSAKDNRHNIVFPLDRIDGTVVNVRGADVGNKVW